MKMLTKEQEKRQVVEILCTDMLVPRDHLLRKIDGAVDFTHIYDLVANLYCEDNGRPRMPVTFMDKKSCSYLLENVMRQKKLLKSCFWFSRD